VRTLPNLPPGGCDPTTFTARQVGLFTIACAERPANGVVSLALQEGRLDSAGWYLVWNQTPDLDRQHALSPHWSLALQD
jgi:hypothetical protein